MKLADWGALGRAGEMLQGQLAELGAVEEATHVTVNPDSGRLRSHVLEAGPRKRHDRRRRPIGFSV
jgi:hypothetical protein